MTVTAKNIIPSKLAEDSLTTQYTANNVTTIIDKFTATNFETAAATLTVNLVTAGGSASNTNVITKSKTLQPSEVYTFPELVGHVLSSGSFIATVAGTALSISIRASGREIT
jgi:ATP-dependent protease ClpP protease subunit